MKEKNIDKIFFGLIITLTIVGIAMFTSASMGILAKNPAKFYDVIFNQFIFGLLGGGIAMYCAYRIPYKFWKTYSLTIFIVCILITAAVFIPKIGFSHGGARRWINIFGISLQPVEFLKIAFVIYFAAWLSWVKVKVQDIKFSIIPLVILLAIIAGVLLKQPDTKSVILIVVTALVMLFISGMSWKYILGILGISLLGLGLLVSFTPYLKNRVDTFLHPSRNQSTSSYQLQQSLIAIGSGGVFGRGLGQSIQKYSYLPEPQGDSIFAVIGEETGFVGTVSIIILFIIFAFRGFKIGYYAPDSFSKILVIGLITITLAQAFMNIASIIGVFPLTGVPLPFISHGGTSLLITLGAMGIILNISRFQKKN